MLCNIAISTWFPSGVVYAFFDQFLKVNLRKICLLGVGDMLYGIPNRHFGEVGRGCQTGEAHSLFVCLSEQVESGLDAT